MMKALTVFSVILFCAGAAIGQTPASAQDPPDLAVLKFSWAKERIGWERDPFKPPVENNDEMRIRQRDEKRIEDAKRGGNQSEVNKLEREARADAAILAKARQQAPPREAYRYKVSVKNTGAKTIKLIDWDYIFFDPVTDDKLAHHQFTSEEKIKPGHGKELEIIILTPPVLTISAEALNKKGNAVLKGQVILVRIEYTDGTVWQRPQVETATSR
jgi:hypothetical protein